MSEKQTQTTEFKTGAQILEFVKTILGSHNLVPTFCAVYGSHVYGTASTESDYDVYVIAVPAPDASDLATVLPLDLHQNHTLVKDEAKTLEQMIDLTVRSFDQFKNQVKKGDPQAIEILLSPAHFVPMGSDEFKEFKKSVDLKSKEMKGVIRSGFSEKSSWAESRARKKFKDGEYHIALKSQFHSYRILCYGIQIGLRGEIYDWGFPNDYLNELLNTPEVELSEQFFRDSIKKWTKTKLLTLTEHGVAGTVASCFKSVLPK